MVFAVVTPPNQNPITSVRAILSRDKNGNEGIVGVEGIGPMVTASDRVLEHYKSVAKLALGKVSNVELFVVEFSNPKDIEKL